MKKQTKILSIVIFSTFLISFVSASCSDINLKITGLNMEYNFMQGEISSGETQIKEIKVYLDDELKMTDTSESFKKNILFPSFKEALSTGQEIRIDVILDDGTICENKEVLIVSEDKIIAPTPKCDYNQKKEDWCVGDLVMGNRCDKGEWEEFVDVDCSYWNGTCKNGKCVEIENENNILVLTELDNSSEGIEKLNVELKKPELMQTQLVEDSSDENFIKAILNWFINIFGKFKK